MPLRGSYHPYGKNRDAFGVEEGVPSGEGGGECRGWDGAENERKGDAVARKTIEKEVFYARLDGNAICKYSFHGDVSDTFLKKASF